MNSKKILVYLLLCVFSGSAYAVPGNMPEPYRSIKKLPFDPHHYLMEINRAELIRLVTKYQPRTIVEVGVWLGTSASVMASCMPEGGKLYAVDHWLGSYDHQDNPHLKNKSLYQQFLSNVIHNGLTDKIVPVRMDSLEAVSVLDVEADMIYIDASHDEASVYKDIMAWYPKLKKGGLFCGDDYGWAGVGYRSVKAAVDRAIVDLGVELKVVGNWFWYFEPRAEV